MADERNDDDGADNNDVDEDASYLTPAFRKKFERQGSYLVEQQVLHLRYEAKEKRLAAMQWLREVRRRERRNNTLLVAVPTILAALVGAFLGAWMTSHFAAQLGERQASAERSALAMLFRADISALEEAEGLRHKFLKPHLKTLVTVSYPNGNKAPRPWLMAPATLRFPVFEQNASRLGMLDETLAREIAELYGMSYRLRSHVNVVLSPAIIVAGTPDKKFAVTQYENTLMAWQTKAKRVRVLLRAFQRTAR